MLSTEILDKRPLAPSLIEAPYIVDFILSFLISSRLSFIAGSGLLKYIPPVQKVMKWLETD